MVNVAGGWGRFLCMVRTNLQKIESSGKLKKLGAFEVNYREKSSWI
jgi:hypothetical protein